MDQAVTIDPTGTLVVPVVVAGSEPVPMKRKGRPPGIKNKPKNPEGAAATSLKDIIDNTKTATATKAAVMAVAPAIVPPVDAPVTVKSLSELADFLDYWKKEANLTTLQCLRLYAR